MIKRIIVYFIFFCLIIAIPLALAGIHRVTLGPSVRAFLGLANNDLNEFRIAIPEIPSIPKLKDVNGFFAVINLLISFFNGIIAVLNILITLLNYLIQVIQFLVILLKRLIFFRDSLRDIEDTFQYIPIILPDPSNPFA